MYVHTGSLKATQRPQFSANEQCCKGILATWESEETIKEGILLFEVLGNKRIPIIGVSNGNTLIVSTRTAVPFWDRSIN